MILLLVHVALEVSVDTVAHVDEELLDVVPVVQIREFDFPCLGDSFCVESFGEVYERSNISFPVAVEVVKIIFSLWFAHLPISTMEPQGLR